MNESLISLLGIFLGIIGANLITFISNKHSFSFTGNTIIGVFGSVFFTKLIGRFGINPFIIANNNNLKVDLLIIYLSISLIGGFLIVIIIKKILNEINWG